WAFPRGGLEGRRRRRGGGPHRVPFEAAAQLCQRKTAGRRRARGLRRQRAAAAAAAARWGRGRGGGERGARARPR
ncbi:hypothetical protein P7K49_030573, partial [Saguinus oedipus]